MHNLSLFSLNIDSLIRFLWENGCKRTNAAAIKKLVDSLLEINITRV